MTQVAAASGWFLLLTLAACLIPFISCAFERVATIQKVLASVNIVKRNFGTLFLETLPRRCAATLLNVLKARVLTVVELKVELKVANQNIEDLSQEALDISVDLLNVRASYRRRLLLQAEQATRSMAVVALKLWCAEARTESCQRIARLWRLEQWQDQVRLLGKCFETWRNGDRCASSASSPKSSALSTASSQDTLGIREYQADIYGQMVADEARFMVRSSYISFIEALEGRRGLFVNWMVKAHLHFSMSAPTLFLAVNIVDRFLQDRPTARPIKLVCLTALALAAKFEEIYPPTFTNCVSAMNKDNAFSTRDMEQMEVQILNTLGFHIACPTTAHFLGYFHRVHGYSEEQAFLIEYLLSFALVDTKMLQEKPSLLVEAAIFLSDIHFRQSQRPLLLRDASSIQATARKLLMLCWAAPQPQLEAVRSKFLTERYQKVAAITFFAARV